MHVTHVCQPREHKTSRVNPNVNYIDSERQSRVSVESHQLCQVYCSDGEAILISFLYAALEIHSHISMLCCFLFS